MSLPKVIATSVVRGSQQGESHGGVFIIDLDTEIVDQVLDWDTCDIDFEGRGADRGLRGIAFDGLDIYIAASNEIFVFDQNFKIKKSFSNPYLHHCHEIYIKGRVLFLTSTGFDSILGYNLDDEFFFWGITLSPGKTGPILKTFNPMVGGPQPSNLLHINSVFKDQNGLFVGARNLPAIIQIKDSQIEGLAQIPLGTHNATPYIGGTLFNDTMSDKVRFIAKQGVREFEVPKYPEDELINKFRDTSKIARQGFGRGLCMLDKTLVAGGSSPSTISVHDLYNGKTLKKINFSMDIRNAIHGLEIWPYGWPP